MALGNLKMTTLRRAPNGDYFSRRMIPADVRAAYKATFGLSQEARFRAPASAHPQSSEATVQGLGRRGHLAHRPTEGEWPREGLPMLTQRQAHASPVSGTRGSSNSTRRTRGGQTTGRSTPNDTRPPAPARATSLTSGKDMTPAMNSHAAQSCAAVSTVS
jgi:hypothetical protein